MTLLVFLTLNEKWIEIKPRLLYEIAVLVADSKPAEREYIIKETTMMFKEHIVNKNI